MKRLLNTLYITTEGAYLQQDGETIVVTRGSEQLLRFPLHGLESIVAVERVVCSAPLMGACAERGISMSFLTPTGRFQARVYGPVSGNVLLRREQYRRADDPDGSAAIARCALIAKVSNARNVLLRAHRDHPAADGDGEVVQAAERLRQIAQRLCGPLPLDTARGYEGEAAKTYFGVFDHLIVSQKDAFRFERRSRRPPLDPVNALLSFIYSLLTHDTVSALETVGLDPSVGYLHRDRPGRPGLALDIMEEFRPSFADRLVLSLINRQQVAPGGFRITESGAVMMDDDTRKQVLVAYQERKQQEVSHPFVDEKVPIGLLPHVQAMLLARHLRGELDAYPPYVWR
jgi:CRISPR-associated protein Cas1